MVSAYLCNMEEVLGSAQLPALPHSAIHLLELTKNEDNGPAEYALPIEADPRLAGQILKFINSTYFGFANEVTSIQLGINLVGIRSIKNFALWTAVFSLIPSMQVGRFDIRLLWQDSLRRALFAQAMSKYLNVDVPNEDLFTAALLQDLAIPILMREFPNEYPKMFEYRVEKEDHCLKLKKKSSAGITPVQGHLLRGHGNCLRHFVVILRITRKSTLVGALAMHLSVSSLSRFLHCFPTHSRKSGMSVRLSVRVSIELIDHDARLTNFSHWLIKKWNNSPHCSS